MKFTKSHFFIKIFQSKPPSFNAGIQIGSLCQRLKTVELVGKIWYNPFGFRGGIPHHCSVVPPTSYGIGHESQRAKSLVEKT